MAVYSNIVIDQGADYSASIDVTDSDGDNFNLTGYAGAGQVRKSYSSTTAGSPTVSTSGDDTIMIFTGSGSYTG